MMSATPTFRTSPIATNTPPVNEASSARKFVVVGSPASEKPWIRASAPGPVPVTTRVEAAGRTEEVGLAEAVGAGVAAAVRADDKVLADAAVSEEDQVPPHASGVKPESPVALYARTR
jgi:hypothetical protein